MAEEFTPKPPLQLGIIEPSDAPLVDEALAQPKADFSDAVAEQVAALKDEVASLSIDIANMTDAARTRLKSNANAVEALVDETVRLHPVLSVLTAAGMGYLLALIVHGVDRHR